jgi:hypothetical protein
MPPIDAEGNEIDTGILDSTLLNPGEGDLPPGGEGGDDDLPPMFIGDFDEEAALGILTGARDMPDNLNAMESRFQGNLSELNERFTTYEKGLPTQSSFDLDKLHKGLEAYDPKLAEVLGPLLQDAFQTSPLDETTLRPHIDPIRTEMQEWMGQQLVLSAYSPEVIADIVPPVKDGRFEPSGQRHEDFMGWYSKQGYQTQQSLLTFGAPYVQALRSFEKWESKLNEERAEKAGKQTQRLQNGQVPSSRSRIPPTPKAPSADEAFAAGFDEAFEEVKR